MLITNAHDKVSTIYYWAYLGLYLKNTPPQAMYGDEGSDYHPNYLINGRQIFII